MEETTRKQIVLGILAHVDSGKTTLSEAMLYRAGAKSVIDLHSKKRGLVLVTGPTGSLPC